MDISVYNPNVHTDIYFLVFVVASERERERECSFHERERTTERRREGKEGRDGHITHLKP